MTIDDPHIHAIGQRAACDIRPVTEPYRQAVAPGKGEYPPNMIAVFMGHQHPGNIAGFAFQSGETAKCLALPEAAIDHQTGSIALY